MEMVAVRSWGKAAETVRLLVVVHVPVVKIDPTVIQVMHKPNDACDVICS